MKIQTELKPTEDPEKLKKHIKRLLPSAKLQVNEEDGTIQGESHFTDLWNKARRQEIRKTIWERLKRNNINGTTSLKLDKTAASKAKLSIYSEAPLGEIKVEMPWQKVEEHKQEAREIENRERDK